jgi:hypothetical protein
MPYHLNAEGDNGVRIATTLDNLGMVGPNNTPVILRVRGDVPSPYPNPYIDAAGIEASGNNEAPGIVGYNFGGLVSLGVGVAGISQGASVGVGLGSYYRDFPSFEPLIRETAGVYGFCQAGPGVSGRGSDAVNDSYPFPDPSAAAGTGVIGKGGNGAPAVNFPADGSNPAVSKPVAPGGAGVVGLGGGALMPTADARNGAGVVGVGSPLQNGSYPGRGGVFASTGYAAQVRLIPGPPTNEQPRLPVSGEVGDLYITGTVNPLANLPGGPPVMFMCITPGQGKVAATWVPFQVGPPQRGGTVPEY